MSERIQTIIITVVLFVAGLLIGVWTQRSRPFPPPPIASMGEFGMPRVLGEFPHHHHHYGMGYFMRHREISPEEMRRRLAALEPQIRAFRSSIAGIEGDFRKGFNAILTPGQRSQLDEIAARHHHRYSDGARFGCAGELGTPLVPLVIYRPLLDRMTQMLSLTPAQHDQLEALLVERRTRFLKFVDDNPPPSFRLRGMMASVAPGSGAPPPASPEPKP